MSRRKEDVEDINEYMHLLNDEEKAWMAKFMKEYNNAMLDTKNLKNNLHNTQELKKSCTDRNNARNRCIYSREKAKGMLNLAGSDSELEKLYYGGTEDDDLEEEDTVITED